MSYTKNTWNTGDTVTAEKLNNLENGVVNAGALKVVISYDETTSVETLSETFLTIKEAVMAGRAVFAIGESLGEVDVLTVANLYWDDGYGCAVGCNGGNGMWRVYECESENDYPSYNWGSDGEPVS